MPTPLLLAADPVVFGQSALPWITLAILVALAGCMVLLNALLNQVKQVDERLGKLDLLKDLETTLNKVVERQGDLDLRRLEHALIDIRDGQKRQEERLIGILEASARAEQLGDAALPAPGSPAAALADRAISRLLAMGYERVELLTPLAEIAEIVENGGDLDVEARRGGAYHKGRLVVSDGRITDVKLRDSYRGFP